ncbi:phage portal protein [Desemzia sp. C1]|uniref:phage portal protein n=1 Tax=Desemzia sp. C1 TaxID=2892016 RepID=UPI001E5D5C44|nr:phage portal protein [Desemzia sp. C1]MCI3029823.1 phage portal protein [Desemzia sp. C1]
MKIRFKRKCATFIFSPFSVKQLQVLSWWEHPKHKEKDAIICDGSVRAGKTLIKSLSYIIWSMQSFDGQQFGITGKTIGSLRRNVINLLKTILLFRGYKVKDLRSDNILEITKNGKTNHYFLFGGKDESSKVKMVQLLNGSRRHSMSHKIQLLSKSIEDNVHKVTYVPNMNDENFAGNISGEAMKYKLFGLLQLMSIKSRYMTKGLRQRLQLMANMRNVKRNNIDVSGAKIKIKPNLPINTSDIID